MAFSKNICRLVIENVELLQEAPNVIEEIETEIFKAINTRFEDFFKDREDWKTCEDDDDEIVFAQSDWPEEDSDYSVFYNFGRDSDEESYLAALVGKNPENHYGIYFSTEHRRFGMNVVPWRTFLATQYRNRPILQASGVTLEGEYLCIPITIDPKLMAEEYPDFDACLKPVDDALEILMKVNPQIDEIVKELKKLAPV